MHGRLAPLAVPVFRPVTKIDLDGSNMEQCIKIFVMKTMKWMLIRRKIA
jgi:hypothetical protein